MPRHWTVPLRRRYPFRQPKGYYTPEDWQSDGPTRYLAPGDMALCLFDPSSCPPTVSKLTSCCRHIAPQPNYGLALLLKFVPTSSDMTMAYVLERGTPLFDLLEEPAIQCRMELMAKKTCISIFDSLMSVGRRDARMEEEEEEEEDDDDDDDDDDESDDDESDNDDQHLDENQLQNREPPQGRPSIFKWTTPKKRVRFHPYDSIHHGSGRDDDDDDDKGEGGHGGHDDDELEIAIAPAANGCRNEESFITMHEHRRCREKKVVRH